MSLPTAVLENARGRADRRLPVVLALGAIGYLVAYAALTETTSSRWGYGVDNFGTALLAVCAAYVCAFKSQRPTTRQRLAWRLLGGASVAFAISDIDLGWHLSIRGEVVATPPIYSIASGLTIVLAYLAIVLLPAPQLLFTEKTRGLLDGLILAGSLLVVLWVILDPSAADAHRVGGTSFIGDVLPAIAVIGMLALTGSVALRWQSKERSTLVLLALAELSFAASAVAGAYSSIRGVVIEPPIDDMGYAAAFFLLMMAALVPAPSVQESRERRPSTAQAAAPYLVALGAAASEVFGRSRLHRFAPVVIGASIGVLLSIIIRQLLVIIENRRLTTALVERETSLLRYATQDALTGLANRSALDARLSRAVLDPDRPIPEALMLLDLDRFKRVNDTLGHPLGDRLLQVIAQRLQRCVREEDIVARMGGDEFAVVLEPPMPEEGIAGIAQRIISSITELVVLDDHQVSVGASVGVAVSSVVRDPTELLRDADVALYEAKHAGGNDFRFFDPRLAQDYLERLEVTASLAQALEGNELLVTYQPIIDLQSGMPAGAEALLRWQHPRRGWLTPSAFLAFAEDSGAIVPIGRWVLKESLAQAQHWRRELPHADEFWISVNVSARQVLADDIAASVAQALATSGIDASGLKVELTESMLIDHSEATTALLESTRALGVNLSLDDFGTGYSSLSYLRTMPIGSLKIDSSFVSQLDVSESETLIIEAIVKLAHALGLEVVAEGIERRSQFERLRDLGCRYGQGHLWSPSLIATEFESWWRREIDEVSARSSAQP